MWDEAAVAEVLVLAQAGLNRCEISRRTGVPRTTVRDWLCGKVPSRERRRRPPLDVREVSPDPYSYLLGVYLGDGCIVHVPRSYQLRVACDARYAGIVAEISAAMAAVMPGHSVRHRLRRTERCLTISSTSIDWPLLFPQHGPGRKHRRRIELVPWQAEITTAYPRQFVRGLLQTDGTRYVARQRRHGKVYCYPRYSFSNRSGDIRRLLIEHLELLEIRCRHANRWNIEIARREAVAALDDFVGPKR
ncbi:MAG: helix-turn-helix domain-containing protein [Gaiellaceae bacterium]